jgi:regulatory protein
MKLPSNSSNFLNEELCLQFCQRKHRIKQWGKIRITNELKFKINARLISTALKITPKNEETFQNLADRTWENSSETNALKKKRNFVITYCVKGLRVI